jgi:hypothetical protein
MRSSAAFFRTRTKQGQLARFVQIGGLQGTPEKNDQGLYQAPDFVCLVWFWESYEDLVAGEGFEPSTFGL